MPRLNGRHECYCAKSQHSFSEAMVMNKPKAKGGNPYIAEICFKEALELRRKSEEHGESSDYFEFTTREWYERFISRLTKNGYIDLAAKWMLVYIQHYGTEETPMEL